MLNITPIPAFRDNYLWLFHKANTTGAYIFDPGDAAPVIDYLEANDLELEGILVTHHHADHTGGISELLSYREVPVIGPDSPKIPAITRHVGDADSISLSMISFDVLTVPGHTIDHIAYYSSGDEGRNPPVLFCGDTLFAGGCGRLFEGTPPIMYNSLQKLAALPENTFVYCTHEYTVSNLNFARAVLPGCEAINERLNLEKDRRARNIPTVPTTLAEELRSNIFLRCGEDVVKKAAETFSGRTLTTPEEVFGVIRSWKDQF